MAKINTLMLVKGEERYIFIFRDNDLEEILRIFDKFASDPDLSFTSSDAKIMSRDAKEIVSSKLLR